MRTQLFKRGPARPAMNITPLIDVVFLLLVFFMLVNTIVSRETAPMLVPRLDEPSTSAMQDGQRVIVSVMPQPFSDAQRQDDPLLFDGRAQEVRVGTQRIAMNDLARVTEALRHAREANPDVEVLLRADAAIYYEQVQPVMDAIAAAGVNSVKVVAYMSEGGRGSSAGE